MLYADCAYECGHKNGLGIVNEIFCVTIRVLAINCFGDCDGYKYFSFVY